MYKAKDVNRVLENDMCVSTEDLEKFVEENNTQLRDIKTSREAFNIFNVLGVQYREICHSNFLGWLFEPNESHNLGDIFLKGLLQIICENTNPLSDPTKYNSLLESNLQSTKVYRETVHNIDILIVNEERNFVIVIENKIHASYSKNQLKKYYKYVNRNFSDIDNKIYLTLTPETSTSHLGFKKGKAYKNINYQSIVDLVKRNTDSISKASATIKESINQYVTMVENDITKTSKEVRLAKEIYRDFKKEIDFIIRSQEDFSKYKKVVKSYLLEKERSFIESHDSGDRNVIFLLPDDEKLLKLFSYPEAKSRNGEYIFSIVIMFEKDKVWLKFSFGDIQSCENHIDIKENKTKFFNTMQKFKCFKNTNGKVNRAKNEVNKDYATVFSVDLFNDVELLESNKSFMELFEIEFEEVNKDIIKPWTKQCADKLPNSNGGS